MVFYRGVTEEARRVTSTFIDDLPEELSPKEQAEWLIRSRELAPYFTPSRLQSLFLGKSGLAMLNDLESQIQDTINREGEILNVQEKT